MADLKLLTICGGKADSARRRTHGLILTGHAMTLAQNRWQAANKMGADGRSTVRPTGTQPSEMGSSSWRRGSDTPTPHRAKTPTLLGGDLPLCPLITSGLTAWPKAVKWAPITHSNLRDRDAMTEELGIVLPANPLELPDRKSTLSLKQRWLYFREYNGPYPKSTGQAHSMTAGSTICRITDGHAFGASGLDRKLVKRTARNSSRHGSRVWRRSLPGQLEELVTRIDSRAAGDASRWDVFAWKPKLRFINMMRAGSSEMLSPSKLLWLQAALAEGVPSSTFEIWRWFGGALDGRVLRLTDYNLDRLDGWVNTERPSPYSDGRQREGMGTIVGCPD